MALTAFLFPGQGSQSVGMLADIGESYPIIKQAFAHASTILGYDLWEVCQHGPAERLNTTEITQPVMLVADIALWQLWRETSDCTPAMVAGHSLGEYAALVAAEAISFADAIKLVALRGRLMQQAVPVGAGAMAVMLGATEHQVTDLCDEAAQGQVLSIANDNAPGQIVIAGEEAAVERALTLASNFGVRIAKKLPVSVPSHCRLMQPAVSAFEAALAEVVFSTPIIPVIHNADVLPKTDPQSIRAILLDQLTLPVRWVETIQYMQTAGVASFVECGPGNVLRGLNKRIISGSMTYSLNTPSVFLQTHQQIKEQMDE